MKADEPTPLGMSWAQFVWLSLALGARPDDPAWDDKCPCTLEDSEGNVLITLFESDGRLCARLLTDRHVNFSLNRAFAWRNIMMEKNRLWALGSRSEFAVPLNLVQISPDLSILRSTEDLKSGMSSVLRGKEVQDCDSPLASACRWMLYVKRHREETGELLPVSHRMLEYRHRILCYLKLLMVRGDLETKVHHLVCAHSGDRSAVGTIDENLPTNNSQKHVDVFTGVARDALRGLRSMRTSAEATTTVDSASAAQNLQQHMPERGHSYKRNQSFSGEKQDPTPLHRSEEGINSHESSAKGMSLKSNSPGIPHTNGDSDHDRDPSLQPSSALVHVNPARFIIEVPATTRTPGYRSPIHSNAPETPAKAAAHLTASESKAASIILDSIRSTLTASVYVQRYDRVVHVIDGLGLAYRTFQRRHRFQESLNWARAGLRSFNSDCNELKALTNESVRKEGMANFYALIPLVRRKKFEHAVLSGSFPSPEILDDDADDTRHIAYIALASAD